MRFPNNHQGLTILLSKQISNSSCWMFSVTVITFHQNCHLHLLKGHWDNNMQGVNDHGTSLMWPPCISVTLRFYYLHDYTGCSVNSELFVVVYKRLIFTSLPLFNCFFACNILSLIIMLLNLTVLSLITHFYNTPMQLFWLLFCGYSSILLYNI